MRFGFDLVKGTPWDYAWVDGAYWSLLIEIRFYIILWAFYYLLKLKYPIFFLASLGLLAPLELEWGKLSKSNDFLIYLPFFAFGMATGKMSRDRIRGLLLMSYCFLIFIFISFSGVAAISMKLNRENVLSYGSCFLIFLLCMIFFKNARSRMISYLGIITYPLYLLHQDIGLIFIGLMGNFSNLIAATFAFVSVFLLSVAVNQLIEKYQSSFRIRIGQP